MFDVNVRTTARLGAAAGVGQIGWLGRLLDVRGCYGDGTVAAGNEGRRRAVAWRVRLSGALLKGMTFFALSVCLSGSLAARFAASQLFRRVSSTVSSLGRVNPFFLLFRKFVSPSIRVRSRIPPRLSCSNSAICFSSSESFQFIPVSFRVAFLV